MHGVRQRVVRAMRAKPADARVRVLSREIEKAGHRLVRFTSAGLRRAVPAGLQVEFHGGGSLPRRTFHQRLSADGRRVRLAIPECRRRVAAGAGRTDDLGALLSAETAPFDGRRHLHGPDHDPVEPHQIDRTADPPIIARLRGAASIPKRRCVSRPAISRPTRPGRYAGRCTTARAAGPTPGPGGGIPAY